MMKSFTKWLVAPVILVFALWIWVAWECRDLPRESELRGQIFAHYHPQVRSTWVPIWAISPKLQTAVVAWEDPRFYFHHGLDYEEIGRAFLVDLRARRYRHGGSTITQQVAKNLFLSPEKTLRRKLREAVLARRLEHVLAKNEILEIYLNIADWGDGVTGAEAAARFYFDKSAEGLDWAEGAMLAAILANPHRLNPRTEPERVLHLRQEVLQQLLEGGELGEEAFRRASAEPLLARLRRPMRIPAIQVEDESARWDHFVHFAIRTPDGKDQPLPWTTKLAAALRPIQSLSTEPLQHNSSICSNPARLRESP